MIFCSHPVTRARWRRFHSMKRARFSALFLLLLLLVSLFSEWLANNKPLLVRHNGHYYWPILKFYPEDTFLQNGRMTPPDYKALAQTAAFAPDSGNTLWWPPMPFGPLEILKPEDIRLGDSIQWTATPVAKAAALDVAADGTIVRTIFHTMENFPLDFPQYGKLSARFSTLWKIPPELEKALAARFQNEAAPPLDVFMDDLNLWISLSPFQPRATAPSTVRLTLREELAAGKIERMRLPSADLSAWPAAFRTVSDDIKRRVLNGDGAEWGGWHFKTAREDVRFPFRPSPGHPMGIDHSGRDVAVRMLYALRTSLLFGLLLVVVTMAIGTVIGAVQGYYGGYVDLLGQRSIEIWESLPFIYVLILLGSVYGQSFGLLLGVYGIFNWIGISYYMRAEFLRLRHWPFVEAAQVMGLPAHKIIFRHILPNALVPIITFFPFSLVGAIGSLAALDYLGFGLPPPSPSWGELLSQAQEFSYAWWLVLWPALALFSVMLAAVFVGEGLRAAFDPKKFGWMDG